MATNSRLKGFEEKRGQLAEASREASSAISSLEDFTIHENENVGLATRGEKPKGAAEKLEAARVFQEKMQSELRTLCSGLEQRLASIGYSVEESYRFSGSEKWYAWWGKTLGWGGLVEKAKSMRLKRLEGQSVKESVKEISDLIKETIEELGEIERQYTTDYSTYNATITRILKKLRESQPLFAEAKANRERLESELELLKTELASGTVTQDERPAKEAEYDKVQKEYLEARLKETDLLEIINNANRALPEVQKSRDAAKQAEEAIHQMRRGLLEKLQNFEVVLENAMTAVKARARLERYKDIDPAFNKTVEMLTENNIKTAGAAMALAIERAKKAAIDPDKSRKLLNELLAHINDYATGIDDLEEEAKQGNRPINTPKT